MSNPSPYELIKRAARAQQSDRWAALSHNARERVPVHTPPHQQAPHASATTPVASAAPAVPVAPPEPASPYALTAPPFPPPQPRHPFLDEIEKRHEQALKSALAPQKWQPGQQNQPAGGMANPSND